MSMDDMRNKSEYVFKKELRKKIKSSALKYLKNIIIEKDHSKMEKLKYESLTMQSYFLSKFINKNEAQQLFMFRTRMARFANNFRNGSAYIKCPLCNEVNSIDSEVHSLSCEEIIKLLPEITTKTITVNNFYSNNVQDLKKTVNIFMEIMKIRTEILSKKNS